MNDLIFILDLVVIIGSAAALVFYSLKFIVANSRKSNIELILSRADNLLYLLDKVIESSVWVTNKTIVNKLKKSQNYFQIDKEEAFAETIFRIYSAINLENPKALYPYIEDINEWIKNRIEYYVYFEKRLEIMDEILEIND